MSAEGKECAGDAMIETLSFSNNLYVEHMIAKRLLREPLMFYERIMNFIVKLALIKRRISIKRQVPGKVVHKMNA